MRSVAVAILLLTLLAALAPATAAPEVAPDAAAVSSRAVILVHHPLDLVDPFGVPFEGRDTFAARYQGLADATHSFPFPTFVADGIEPVLALPRPDIAYQGTLDNYTTVLQGRLRIESPMAIRLVAEQAGASIHAAVTLEPVAPLVEPSGATLPHLWAAVTEDNIYYKADGPVTNGVTNHRFTVRALQDAGTIDLSSGAAVGRNLTFAAGSDWHADQLVVAVWVQAEAGGRFAPLQVLQAAQAKVGGPAVEQTQKAVLLEMYSATWCSPCLYGDLAIEQVAIRFAGALPASQANGAKYYQWPASDTLPGRLYGVFHSGNGILLLAQGLLLAMAAVAVLAVGSGLRHRFPDAMACIGVVAASALALVVVDFLSYHLLQVGLFATLGVPGANGMDAVLWLALLCAVAALAISALDIRRRSAAPQPIGLWMLTASAVATAAALLFLASRFLAADLSYQYVFFYTRFDLDWQWRLAGTWAGREGSLLLWTMWLGVVAAAAAWTHRRTTGEATWDRARSWTRLILCATLVLFIFASLQDSPFAPTSPNLLQGRPQGNGLEPTLKSGFILIHPPLMFLAYALSALPAAAVIGHLASGTGRWSRVALPWARSGWLVMTFALGLGAMWAYFTLGFGGYFAWDPVEVANLLPWLAFTLYLHAQLHHIRHGSYPRLGPFLGVLPFLLTIFSTISTRSGLWVSVHAFTDPTDAFNPDPAGRFLDIMRAESNLGFYVGLFLAALAVFLALWSHRLTAETGRLRRTSSGLAVVLGAFAVYALAAPASAFSSLLEGAYDLMGVFAEGLRLAAFVATRGYAVAVPLAVLALLLGLWWRRLLQQVGFLRTIVAAATTFCAGLAALALLGSAIAGRLAAAADWLAGSVGLGLMVMTFGMVAVAAGSLLVGPESHTPSSRRGLQRIHLRSLNAYAVVALGLALLVLFLFHIHAVNGWTTGFYEARFPYLAAPVILGLAVLQGHQAYGRKRSLIVAAAILAAAVAAQVLVHGYRAGPFLATLCAGLLVVSLDRVRRAGEAPGTDRRHRIANLILWLAALLDVLFWATAPSLKLGFANIAVPFAAAIGMSAVALVALWYATRILIGAPPRNQAAAYILVGVLGGFYIAAPMAALAWLTLRPKQEAVVLDRNARARLRQVGLFGVHLAMAVALLGYATSTYAKAAVETEVHAGEAALLGSQTITFDGSPAGAPGAPLETITAHMTVRQSGQAPEKLDGTLRWEAQKQAHVPLPATLHRWTGDLYLDVEAVHMAAGGACVGTDHPGGAWIENYKAASPSRACAGDAIDAVRFKAVDLPGIGLLWLALLLLVFYMGLLLFAEPRPEIPR